METRSRKRKIAQETKSRKRRKLDVYDIKFFNFIDLPKKYQNQILKRRNWDNMCQGNVFYEDYAKNAVLSAEKIGVVLMDRKVVGFLLALTSKFKTNLDGDPKPVCLPHEWYLDVICVSPRAKGAGKQLLTTFYKKAWEAGKTAIRLFSVKDAYNYWSKKQGFVECELPCEKKKCFRKQYKQDLAQGVRMTKCLFAHFQK